MNPASSYNERMIVGYDDLCIEYAKATLRAEIIEKQNEELKRDKINLRNYIDLLESKLKPIWDMNKKI
jgi:hypothetical protein